MKNDAKTMMEGKYYLSIMALLLFNMASLLLNNFSSSLSFQVTATLKRMLGLTETAVYLTVLSYLIIFLFTALCNVFRIGFCLFFLNIACNQYYNTIDLFYGFQCFGKSYRLSLLLTAITTLCLSPLDAFSYLYRQSGSLPQAGVMGLLLCLQLILLLLYIPISLSLSQVYYVMLDYPDLSLSEILKQSVKIMNGRKLQLFYIRISFLPLLLLTLLTFGLGSFWLTPYRHMTYTLFYLDSMKKDA